MKQSYEAEKSRVLEWMKKYASGSRNARTKKDILPFVRLTERTFRLISSDLYHEGLIGSTNDKGYWYIDPDKLKQSATEQKAALQSIAERKSRAMDMLRGCNALEEKFKSIKQQDLFV